MPTGARRRWRCPAARCFRWPGCWCSRSHTAMSLLLVGASLLGVGSSVFHPGILARRAHGRRRPSRSGAVAVSGWRQRRPGAGAAGRRAGGGAMGAVEPGVLCAAGAAVGGDPVERGGLVQAPRAGAPRGRRRAQGRCTRRCRSGSVRRGMGVLLAAGVLEVRLSGEPDQLLHVLSDSSLRPVGAQMRSSSCLHSRPRLRSAPCSAGRSAIASAASGSSGSRSSVPCRSRLLLPYANLFWTGPLVVIIGLILASAFPAIVVFAQELVPGRVGMVSGLFFGLAFGVGGLGAAVLGALADHVGHRAGLRAVLVPAGAGPIGRMVAQSRAAPAAVVSRDRRRALSRHRPAPISARAGSAATPPAYRPGLPCAPRTEIPLRRRSAPGRCRHPAAHGRAP